MKAFSLKIKIALSSALIILVGFVLVLLVTFNVAKKNISEAMIEQLIYSGALARPYLCIQGYGSADTSSSPYTCRSQDRRR